MLFSDRAPDDIRAYIRDSIEDAGGSEVLFTGKVDEGKQLTEVYAAARGSLDQVPAPSPHTGSGDVIIHNHPSGLLIPSPADLRVASALGEQGIGFYIVNNSAEEVYVVVEPVPPRRTEHIDTDKLAALIDDGGRLAEIKPGFEPRESQITMLKSVTDGFNNNGIRVLEAGTGVGKSFAYLIPSLAWAEKNSERVIISTATINLQQQLIEKDIPTVQKLLGTNLKTVLVKGRSNYLCTHRLQEQIQEKQTLFDSLPDDLAAIAQWASSSRTGDKSELPFLPDPQLWSSVCADPDACSGRRCRSGEPCFIIKARREAASAQILVANHHLLFADLAMRTKGFGFEATVILPPFQRLVLDEAHNIEKSATSYFSESFTRYSLQKYLRMLLRQQRGRQFGALIELEAYGTLNPALVPPLIHAVQTAAEQLEASTRAVMGERYTLRIISHPEHGLPGEITEGIFSPMKGLRTAINSLTDILAQAVRDVPEEYADEPGVLDVRLLIRRLENVSDICRTFAAGDEHPDRVFWMERKSTSRNDVYIQFSITPLVIAHMMQEAVFEPLATVICTSATMTIRNNFQFFNSRIGLPEDDRCEHQILSSPFAYHERVLLGIPSNAPAPTDQAAYSRYLEDFIPKIMLCSQGSGLILFTSYRLLSEIHAHVKPILEQEGIKVLRQGDDHRSRLLERFNHDKSSVLFATQSFWEGVDTPGDSLRVVVMTRLPFPVPDDPIHQARCDAIDASGGSSFMQLSVPEAIMRFKQGFGRLMRTTSDHGAVIITDNRLITKRYGSLFIGSLPDTVMVKGSTEQILSRLESFLTG